MVSVAGLTGVCGLLSAALSSHAESGALYLKSSLVKEEYIHSDHRWRLQLMMKGESCDRRSMREWLTSHPESNDYWCSTHSLLIHSLPSLRNGTTTFVVDLPTSLDLIWMIPHRHGQRLVSSVICSLCSINWTVKQPQYCQVFPKLSFRVVQV